MITCPKCNKGNNIISEPPSWSLTTNPNDEKIEIQSHCLDCHINFNTEHRIGKAIKVYDITKNEIYPFSA